MTDAAKPSRWAKVLPDISIAAFRFPAAVVLAILYTAFNVFLTNPVDIILAPSSTTSIFSIFLIASFFWVVAADLYVESHGRSWPLRIGLWICGTVAIYLLIHYPEISWVYQPALMASIILGVGLAAYLCRGATATYWLFNLRLWVGWLLAQIAACLFWLGLLAILASLGFLFELDIPKYLYDDLPVVAFGLIGTVSFLAFAPTTFDEAVKEGLEADSVTRAVTIIVKFLFVPLLLVYTTILYAYAAKIGVQGFLPKGQVAGMVVAFVSAGAAILLLAFPIRECGGMLVRFVWRYWLWLALLPVLLLFLALYERVAAYGVTQDRYLLALAGIWILLLAATKLVLRARFDVRVIPGLLAVLLLVASFGPWGARGLSVRSQAAQLATILTEQGALVDGRIAAKPALDKSRDRAGSILFYLQRQGGLRSLRPWFEGRTASPFEPGKTDAQSYRDIAQLLGVPLKGRHHVQQRRFMVKGPMVIDSSNYVRVLGPIYLNSSTKEVDVDGFGTVQLALADGVLKLSLDDDSALSFEIGDALGDLPGGEGLVQHDKPIAINGVGKGLIGTVWLRSAHWRVRTERQETEITRITFWLGISKSE